MSVMLMIPRKSENSLTIVNDSRLTYYQVTDWDIKVIIVLWVLFLVTSVFVFLRLYSRVKILQFYAAEDYLYNIAFVSSFLSFSFFPAFSLLHVEFFPSVSQLTRAMLVVPAFQICYGFEEGSTEPSTAQVLPSLLPPTPGTLHPNPAISRRSEPHTGIASAKASEA